MGKLTMQDKPADVTDAQWRAWLNDLAGAALGNPYATICRHCSVRHAPPRDEDCPRKASLQQGGAEQ